MGATCAARYVAAAAAVRPPADGRVASRWLRGAWRDSARPCAARYVAAAAAVRPPSDVISDRLLRRLIFTSWFCSGLSQAAHEVFGPMFDIGPIWSILKF
ncbi:pentatricopeptide repeat-containing protein mitochondrial [Dorcoceras hygrometricum]|uniref:Pentatricopeptide repeat-containing protein mitochondrial n=1 Tax=Dorcoceras hygrometricum TaxID=472368 RepID=A0A2Z7AVL2_9LAMI|nr:pentatricopeptide repeat-containing protein mitochondrial [Dorcoceras hygrometricum]